MNADQISGLVRSIMLTFSGIAIAHGFTDTTWVAFTGGVVALIGVLWSLYTNSTTSLITSVADKSEVSKVVVTPGLAMSIPSRKVVSQ